YQFYPPRLQELQERETAFYRKEIGYKVPLPEGEEENMSDREAERALDQQEIDNAVALTEEEREEKEELSSQGFGQWNKRDFQQFINGSGRYGRDDFDGIATEVQGKDADEIKTYSKVFWQRYTEIADYPKHIKVIEDGEDRTRRIEHQRKLLRKKMQQYRVPLQQLKINYSVSTTNKKVYTEEEDRFLLVMLDKYGIDSEGLYEKMRDDIRDSPLFRFDWFFLSRTPVELSRRCTTLITTIVKEFEDVPSRGANGKAKREPDEENDEDSVLGMAPAKKKSKNGVKNKAIDNVKSSKSGKSSKASSAAPSRASSVASSAAGSTKSKYKKKK
ncbi:hypothetical protein Golomagni_08133, partial [Golovinomyces magnicellulatus]